MSKNLNICVLIISLKLFIIIGHETIYQINDIDVNFDLYDRNVVQLEISWQDNLPHDTTYNIVVNAANPKQCTDLPCSLFGIIAPAKHLIIPENPISYVADRECNYMLGCNYTVIVETSNTLFANTFNLSIPYCLLDTCSCKHAEKLPKVHVHSKMYSNGDLDLHWSIFVNQTNEIEDILKSVNESLLYIRISEQTIPTLSWGGKLIALAEEYLPFEPSSYNCSNEQMNCFISGLSKISTFTTNLTTSAIWNVQGLLIDKFNCSGPEAVNRIKVPDFKISISNEEINKTPQQILMIITIAILICIFVILVMFLHKRNEKLHSHAKNTNVLLLPDVMEMQDNIHYVDKDIQDALTKGLVDLYEVPHAAVQLGSEIGQGAFGHVFKATVTNLHRRRGNTLVAVKQLKNDCTADEAEEFIREIDMLKYVGLHENIVCILGCCTLRPPYQMIMEYVGQGDLLSYLRNVRAKTKRHLLHASNGVENVINKTNMKYVELEMSTITSASSTNEDHVRQPKPSFAETTYTLMTDEEKEDTADFNYVLDNVELKNFALQIANGMQYLEAQQIVHRDLAARNVLIDNHKMLKISDFGLSRHGIYTNTRTRKLPIRWMSLEAIRDRIYSNKSDVWSYAVVLWEIGTLGASPYCSISNHHLLTYLLAGNRLEKPDICTDHIYSLMLQCWDEDAENRPDFAQLYTTLSPKTFYVDLNSISYDYVFPPIQDKDD